MSRNDYHEDSFTLQAAMPRAPYDRAPIRVPGFPHYCPVCGIGCQDQEEASRCCSGATVEKPKTSGERRIRLGGVSL